MSIKWEKIFDYFEVITFCVCQIYIKVTFYRSGSKVNSIKEEMHKQIGKVLFEDMGLFP